jgi:hypothetical protein
MSVPRTPLVVEYLYVHDPREGFHYPTTRAGSSSSSVAVRYLECALTQAASLRLRDVPCELALATNIGDRSALGRVGSELLDRIEALGVSILPTEYRHRPREGTEIYVSSRYVLDAILSASEGQPTERQLWLTDLDCVWADPELVFQSAVPPSEIGCIYIGYPPDWDAVGFDAHGRTRRAIGELAAELRESWEEAPNSGSPGGAPSLGGPGEEAPGSGGPGEEAPGSGGPGEAPPWVGGELLTGTSSVLRELVRTCEQLDSKLAAEGKTLPNEEQILSLAAAVGPVRFRNLSHVARRMPTGPRNRAAKVEDPLAIGLWHLPSEKGLSLRRVAQQIRRGRTAPLRRDLADPLRAARRFNVAGTGVMRRLQDDGWIVGQRIRSATLSTLNRRRAV